MGAALASTNIHFGSWEAVVLDQVMCRLVLDENGKVLFVNDQFLEKTGWRSDQVKEKNAFQNFIEPNLDKKNNLEWSPRILWQGFYKVKKKNNRSYWTFGHQIPCLRKDGSLESMTVVFNPNQEIPELKRTDIKKKSNHQVLPPVLSNSRLLNLVNPKPLHQPMEWLNLQLIQLQEESAHFFAFLTSVRSGLPLSLQVDTSFIELIVPQALRMSAELTTYGLVHIILEVVHLNQLKKALRFRIEDTGEPLLNAQGKPNHKLLGQSQLARFDQLKALSDSLNFDLVIASDDSGNIIELLVEIIFEDDSIQPGHIELAKWADQAKYRETDDAMLYNKAMYDLKESPLLLNDLPENVEQAIKWVHKYRLNIHYMQNDELFREFSLLEQRLKKNEQTNWLEDYLSSVQHLKNWIEKL